VLTIAWFDEGILCTYLSFNVPELEWKSHEIFPYRADTHWAKWNARMWGE